MLALVAMLYAHLRGSPRAQQVTRWVDVLALWAATVVLVVATARESQPDWRPVAAFAVLPGGIAGLLFATYRAVVVLVGVIAAEALALFSPFTPAITTNVRSDILYPAFAAAVGVVAVSARFVLVRGARRADAIRARTAAAEQERRTSEGVADTIQRRERLLHESVLNTLAAIERGGLTASPGLRARLVARCRESARTLQELLEQAEPVSGDAPATGRLDRDLSGPLADLYASGVAVNLDCSLLDHVPTAVYSALRAATREALTNVGRHAGAQTVWLLVRQTAHESAVGATVEIRDDGRGFDPNAASARFGLPVAIVQTLAGVGGTARIESVPGDGTRVRLEWDSDIERAVRAEYPATAAFAIPILATFALFTAASIALSWSDYSSAAGLNIAALCLYLALAAVLGWASTSGRLQWPVIVPVIALSPLVYQLQNVAVSNGGDWAEWSSIAIASLFLVVAGAGPPWAWLAALCSWMLIQGDVVAELVSAGTAILVAGAVFGRSVRRNATRVERLAVEQVAESSSLAVARESMRRVQQRYAALRDSGAMRLLTDIANGAADPDDPEVRQQAAVEERFVRSVLRVDPTTDAVHALATSLAVRARRRGVLFEADLVAADRFEATDVEPVAPVLVAAIERAMSGRVARLTTRIEGPVLAIRLLVPIETGEREAMKSMSVAGSMVDADDALFLWEILLPLAATTASA